MNKAGGIYLVFDIHDSFFMIPHDYVLGVQCGSPLVPLPFAPPYISGVCKSNSKIITVLNLDVLLGLHGTPERYGRPLQTIVVLDGKQNMGFWAGRRLSAKSFEPSLRIATNLYISKFVKDIYPLGRQQDGFVMELDIPQILSCVMR